MILINLTMIWLGAWEMRDVEAPSSAGLLFILAVGGTYFLAASMVFPSPGADVADLDQHFIDNKKVALLAIAACNLLYLARVGFGAPQSISAVWIVGNGLFVALLVVAAMSSDRRLILAILTTLVATHGLLLFFE